MLKVETSAMYLHVGSLLVILAHMTPLLLMTFLKRQKVCGGLQNLVNSKQDYASGIPVLQTTTTLFAVKFRENICICKHF